MLIKFIAYFFTQSNAILTDALESIVNILASSFAFYSVYLTSLPRDTNHPYGHGKVEFFSVFVEGILILFASIYIIIKSCYNLFFPQKIDDLLIGSIIIAFTGLLNGAFGFYLKSQSKKLNSLILLAEGKHLISDSITSLGLVIGLILIYFTDLTWLDSLISILMGFYIAYSGYKLLRKAIAGLMDESDLDVLHTVINTLNTHRKDPWIDVHNLRTQRYGQDVHIDCHVTLPYYFDLNEVHQNVSQIDKVVAENVHISTEFFIHADPCLPACCHYCNMKNCPVRSEPKVSDIVWTLENVTKNHKHFETPA